MNENDSRWCVFLPCSSEETWAIPQNCLAEIVTFTAVSATPPEQISWRGHTVPVLDLDDSGETPWRDPHGGAGLIAVILGLRDQGNEYWAVALRGEGVAVKNIASERIIDLPERVLERSTAAFEMHSMVYQVPDLPELQKQVGMYRISA